MNDFGSSASISVVLPSSHKHQQRWRSLSIAHRTTLSFLLRLCLVCMLIRFSGHYMCTFDALVCDLAIILPCPQHYYFHHIDFSDLYLNAAEAVAKMEKKKNYLNKILSPLICWHCLQFGCSLPAFLTIRLNIGQRNNDQSILVSIDNFSINPIRFQPSMRWNYKRRREKAMMKMRAILCSWNVKDKTHRPEFTLFPAHLLVRNFILFMIPHYAHINFERRHSHQRQRQPAFT